MATEQLRTLRGMEDSLLMAAADWLVRVQNDDMSVEEIARWQQWLAADARHRAAFERMQTMWSNFGALPDRTLPEIPRPRVYFPRWAQAAAVAVVALGAAAGIFVWNVARAPNTVTVFETQAAEHRDVRLPDGSTLALGAKSLVWIDFSETRRALVLDRGEAFFQVARNKQRPFVVRAGETVITAVGTAFNVRRSGERVLVAVTEGAVNVAAKTETPQLVRSTRIDAQHQMSVDTAIGTASVTPADQDTATAWRSGQRQYLNEPLKYVVADLNRYSTQQIAIGDPAIGELLLTGTVFENDVESWLRSVEDLLPVRIERPAANQVVLEARE